MSSVTRSFLLDMSPFIGASKERNRGNVSPRERKRARIGSLRLEAAGEGYSRIGLAGRQKGKLGLTLGEHRRRRHRCRRLQARRDDRRVKREARLLR